MVQAKYVFEDAATERELRRLRALEAVFDPGTQRQLLATGTWQGRRCLEVGAGAGSIAAWMQEQVGSTGHVVAADMSLRLLDWLPPAIEQLEGDVRRLPLSPESFDVCTFGTCSYTTRSRRVWSGALSACSSRAAGCSWKSPTSLPGVP